MIDRDPDGGSTMINLPTRAEVKAKANRCERLTAVEQLIYWYEPHNDTGSAAFRKLLAEVIFDADTASYLPAGMQLAEIHRCDKCNLCEDHHGPTNTN